MSRNLYSKMFKKTQFLNGSINFNDNYYWFISIFKSKWVTPMICTEIMFVKSNILLFWYVFFLIKIFIYLFYFLSLYTFLFVFCPSVSSPPSPCFLSSRTVVRSQSSLSFWFVSQQDNVLTRSPVAFNTCGVNGGDLWRPLAVNSGVWLRADRLCCCCQVEGE